MNEVKKVGERFCKQYGPKRPLWRYYFRQMLARLRIPQPVEYWSAGERLKFERDCLLLWRAHGFTVPQVYEEPGKQLIMQKMEGETIASLLQRSVPWEPLLLLSFGEMERRHALALALKEPRLCHVDSNLRNILLIDQTICHIDFEMGRLWEPPIAWAERELSKSLISWINAIDQKEHPQLVALFLEQYHQDAVLARFQERAVRKSSHPLAVVLKSLKE